MIVATITSKGQVTIPKKVLEKLGVQPGGEISFDEKEGLVFISTKVHGSRFPVHGISTVFKFQRADFIASQPLSFPAAVTLRRAP